MPRLNADTREEVKAVALELFTTKGFERTSLREIAERLGITKAALYYHFPSKQDLARALLSPLIEDFHTLMKDVPGLLPDQPREVLERYFDLCLRNRSLLTGLLRDTHLVSQLDLINTVIHWRVELDELLVGPAPADRVRTVVALGGLQDCAILFDDPATIRTPAVDAALRSLTASRPE